MSFISEKPDFLSLIQLDIAVVFFAFIKFGYSGYLCLMPIARLVYSFFVLSMTLP
jgi:hypothetical protein